MVNSFDSALVGERGPLLPLTVMAAELGVATGDLRREALAGRVPCVRIGERGVLFDRERVRQMLLRRAQGEEDPQ